MRAAYDSLIGLLTRTVSGGSGQWAINKHKAALGAEQNSLGGTGGGRRGVVGELLSAGSLIHTGVRLATGELEQGMHGRRKVGLREQSFMSY